MMEDQTRKRGTLSIARPAQPEPQEKGTTWTKQRRGQGEVVGGGFVIFRRSTDTGRIRPSNTFPFEHPSMEAAQAEADRLTKANPGETFAVFQQVSTGATD